MKILHIGDVAGVAYKLVGLLNSYDIEAELLTYKDVYKYSQQPWLKYFKSADYYGKSIKKVGVPFECLKSAFTADVVHVHSGFARMFLFYTKPLIIHCHGSEIRNMNNNIDSILMRLSINKSSLVLVSTPDLSLVLKRIGVDSVFLPNPINTSKFQKQKTSTNLHDGFDYVFFHPTSHRWSIKGNDLVIRAFHEISKEYRARLVIVNQGFEVYNTLRLVEKLNLKDKVTVLPVLNEECITDYYNACDVVLDQFVIGSLGQISLEAMACEKPVIVKYENCGGYVSSPPVINASSHADIAKKMRLLIDDSFFRNRVGTLGRLWVEREHNANSVVRKLLNLYRTL